MTRTWMPGDVAIVRNEYGVWNRAICTVGLSGDTWRFGVALTEQPVEGSEARRLVAIDPEDREQIERLAKAMHESDHIAPWHDLHNETRAQIEDAMQAALRSLITPPKPDEPTGLGAVVEDADGVRYVRAPERDGVVWRGTGHWVYKDWDTIAAVKVLSEGVRP